MGDDTMAANTLRRETLGELALRNAEQMAFPATEWEANTLAEVLALPRVTVTRPPEEQLLAAGMLPYDCHANCFAQAANDPDRVSRHVFGWLIYGSDLILHSVVETRGHWLCLTPQSVQAPSQFQFIPDPFIEWLDTGDGGRHAFRCGVRLPKALRKYPAYHLRMWDELNDLMASGMSAFDAREMVDVTLGAELRKMEPI
ncbi:hypothetical protein [Microvirga mediterraneensis]|uniref:Uncharacterized protein n=1 Tax=Microvirga mediterraneensis TaxID=2754695 RepID=A0A838BNT7_9HYPH|nr:hypothetical protein [Microvirga mediterraneensis]MBA1157060.1 hypothetical protein [Microvirga mediterraneensis]